MQMRLKNQVAKKIIISLVIVLLVVGLSALLVRECFYWPGMGAAYQRCECLGKEWLLYDHTAADGPRRSVCIGIVQERTCYQGMGGPRVACAEPDR